MKEPAARQVTSTYPAHQYKPHPPHGKHSKKAMRRKVNKAKGKDAVPPGLLWHLAKECSGSYTNTYVSSRGYIEDTEQVAQQCVTLLCKSGDPMEGRKYPPISIAPAMYVVLTKENLEAIALELNGSLVSEQ